MSKAFTDIETEIKDRNWADSTINFLSSIIGRSSEDLLAKQVGNTVERAVKLSANGPTGKAVQQELANLLQLPVGASTDAITDALNKASPAVQQAAGKILQDAGKKAVASAGSFKTFREGLAESSKVYQDLINTTKNSTPLTKFAEDSSKKIIELAKTLANADLPEKLSALQGLSTDINFLQLFPTEAARNILSTSSELNNLSTELAEVEFRQNLYNDALNDQQKIIDKYNASVKAFGVGNVTKGKEVFDAEKSVKQLNQLNDGLQRTKSTIGTALENSSAKFAESMRTGLIANIDTFTAGLVDASARATLELKKAAVGGINDPRLKVTYQQSIDLKTIELDRKLLNTQMSLIDSNAELRLAIMENTFSQKLDKAGIKGTPEDILSQLNKPENKGLLEEQRSINTFRDNKGKSSAQLRSELKTSGLSTGVMQGMGEAVGQAQAREALNAQLEALKGKESGRILQGKLESIDANKTVNLENLAKLQKDIDQEQLKFAQQKESMSDAEFQSANQVFLIRKADAENASRIIEASAAVQKAQEITGVLGSDLSKKNLDYTLAAFEATKRQSLEERDIAISAGERASEIANVVEYRNRELKAAEQLGIETTARIEQQIVENKQAQDLLAFKEQESTIDSETLKKLMDALKIDEQKLEQTKQLTAARIAYNQEVGKLDLAKEQAGGYIPGGQKAMDDATARKNLEINYETQVKGITSVTNAQIRSAEAVANLSTQQVAYTDLFKQAFKGMEDAIIDFTKTGKLNFKGMIDNFIEGLIRYEIQQQQIMMFRGMGGAGGLAQLFMTAVGAYGAPGSLDYGPGAYPKSAKGSVYDAGLTQFAKGGMFTNGIVDQPTLFKFAKGTGLMGEAGPEAIMPLKRDNNGNLGVRSGGSQSKVDVVVNNYSTSQAETTETVDSRGNRKIEVVIGDMTAGEISRNGSASQRAIRGTFGLQPQLIRR
jgi:lambda family phage tail tape measure protein